MNQYAAQRAIDKNLYNSINRLSDKYKYVTPDLLYDTIYYDKRQGEIVNAQTQRRMFTGLDASGYRTGSIKGTNGKRYQFPANLICWLYAYGKWPKGFVYCLNGDNSDIRLENLKERRSGPKIAYKIRQKPGFAEKGKRSFYGIVYHGFKSYTENIETFQNKHYTEDDAIAQVEVYILEKFSEYELSIDDAYRWYDDNVAESVS